MKVLSILLSILLIIYGSISKKMFKLSPLCFILQHELNSIVNELILYPDFFLNCSPSLRSTQSYSGTKSPSSWAVPTTTSSHCCGRSSSTTKPTSMTRAISHSTMWIKLGVQNTVKRCWKAFGRSTMRSER